ncbi:hypothetical protein, partial [Glaesserella parasuis]
NNKNLTFAVTSGMFGSTTDGRLSKQTAGVATIDAVVSAVNSAGWNLAIARKGLVKQRLLILHILSKWAIR